MDRESNGIRAAFLCYEILWRMFTPLLRLHHRLAEGFRQRRALVFPPPSHLWIQAASVGEAYLAHELLKWLDPGPFPLGVLLTSNTRQGLEIHRQTARLPAMSAGNIRVTVAYFPFDQPTVMRKFVRRVRPAVAVFLETEIWPGLLRELRYSGAHVLVINGRISRRSLDRYLLWPSLWRQSAPHHILAISEADAARFQRLFDASRISVMPNIKFDRLYQPMDAADGDNRRCEPPARRQSPFVILGSVRREEEGAVVDIIGRVRRENPNAVIGLFPRHLHRIGAWRKRLDRRGISWTLRSGMREYPDERIPGGTVMLWDTVGELAAAYECAQAAFVGGSLAPLGGQNFIEALTCGIIPVIGPSWEDFKWVGEALFESGLARIGEDWRAVADHLIHDLNHPPSRQRVQSMARDYFTSRKGGAEEACRLISACLMKRWTAD